MKIDQIGRLGAIGILAATALFGGLDSVSESETKVVPGDAFADGPFTVTVKRASLWTEIASDKKTLLRAKAGREYLVVVAEFQSNGTVDATLPDELDIRDLPDKRWVDAFRLADDTRVGKLGPGLHDELACIWELPEGGLNGKGSITLRIWKKDYRELVVTYGKAWIDNDDYGLITVPLADRR